MRWRPFSSVEIIAQVSSGITQRNSYSLPRGHRNCRVALASNSAHNQFAREKFKHSRVEFQTFRSWIGQIKTYINAHSRTPADPSRTSTSKIVSCRTDRHARPHAHRRTNTDTNKQEHTHKHAHDDMHAQTYATTVPFTHRCFGDIDREESTRTQ